VSYPANILPYDAYAPIAQSKEWEAVPLGKEICCELEPSLSFSISKKGLDSATESITFHLPCVHAKLTRVLTGLTRNLACEYNLCQQGHGPFPLFFPNSNPSRYGATAPTFHDQLKKTALPERQDCAEHRETQTTPSAGTHEQPNHKQTHQRALLPPIDIFFNGYPNERRSEPSCDSAHMQSGERFLNLKAQVRYPILTTGSAFPSSKRTRDFGTPETAAPSDKCLEIHDNRAGKRQRITNDVSGSVVFSYLPNQLTTTENRDSRNYEAAIGVTTPPKLDQIIGEGGCSKLVYSKGY
jgi:hypothetical protein